MDGHVGGIRAKVARALELLVGLDERLHAYLDADPFVLQRHVQPDGETSVFVLKVTSQPPPDLALLVGEIAHQLRSAVDHVAYGLVVAAGNTPTRRTGFPVCVRRPTRLVLDGGVTAEALALIDAFQPYHRPDAQAHPLNVLNALWNVDKHRMLLVTALQSVGSHVSVGMPGGPSVGGRRQEAVGDDGVLGAFRLSGGAVPAEAEVTAGGRNFAALGVAGHWPANLPVQLVLEDLHRYVAVTLVPRFEPLLAL